MQDIRFPAHIRSNSNQDPAAIQSVSEHCRQVGEYARDSLSSVSLAETAFLSGVLHDMGKEKRSFAEYITNAAKSEKAARGTVNHTFAGVRYALTELQSNPGEDASVQELSRELIAYAIGSHHGQFDCVDENGCSGFRHRVQKEDIDYTESRDNYLLDCIAADELQQHFEASSQEVSSLMVQLRQQVMNSAGTGSINQNQAQKLYNELCFYLGLTARLVQSAVIDGDRRDTAEFMMNRKYQSYPDDMRPVWKKQLDYAEKIMTGFDNTSAINQARSRISSMCRMQADQPEGLYRLNVPTGAGKTISSLRFALAHAARWNKSRIIFTSPLLSILEQNAHVIRNYIQDQELILEHHSNAVQPVETEEKLNLDELHIENWESPVIITTLVQLLNTFFSGETSCIRRFHSLAGSVIVIDEVQSVPLNLLSMFNLTITYLVQICHASVVLCSATQPFLEGADYPVALPAKDIVPHDPELWEVFRRTEIIDCGCANSQQLGEKLADLADQHRSTLIICNKKSESEHIFQVLQEKYGSGCFHLSASMCIEHRRKVLEKIRSALARSKEEDDASRVVCVSTQVIEAGVDISFESVIRLQAGMDNLVQASGRCNRNGENETPCCVYNINCTDENLTKLRDIQNSKAATESLLYSYKTDPERYGRDLTSDDAIRQYYSNLYQEYDAGYQDDIVKGFPDSVLSMLGSNGKLSLLNRDNYIMKQSFRLAGKAFHVFDSDTCTVIVPYGDMGKELINDLNSERAQYDPAFVHDTLRKARSYTVTLFPYQQQILERQGAIQKCRYNDVWFLSEGYYSETTGVTMSGDLTGYMEV